MTEGACACLGCRCCHAARKGAASFLLWWFMVGTAAAGVAHDAGALETGGAQEADPDDMTFAEGVGLIQAGEPVAAAEDGADAVTAAGEKLLLLLLGPGGHTRG